MSNYKKPSQRVFYILMSIFLMWQSYKLTILLLETGQWNGIAQLFFAALINLFFTGVFAFAGFALPTENLIPQKYYTIHQPEKLKSWFQFFRTESFRKFLLVTVWRKKEMQKDLFDGKVESLNSFEQKTKKSEFGHLIPLFLITILCVFLVKTKMWILISITMIINIIFNFYPVILQRHHRMRLQRMRKIMVHRNRK